MEINTFMGVFKFNDNDNTVIINQGFREITYYFEDKKDEYNKYKEEVKQLSKYK